MLETKGVDVMKWTQDRMSNPVSDSELETLGQRAKEIGATQVSISIPFGLSNTVAECLRWATAIRSKGMKVTWRMDDPSKHPMYNQPIAVGSAALSTATYHSRVKSFIESNPNLFQESDEWAIYYEPTSFWSGDGKTVHIFNAAISWLTPNSPQNFSDFFIGLYDVSVAAFATIGKNVKCGLTSSNGSEYMGGHWIEKRLVDKVGYVCTDHYVDGDPAKLEEDLRAMKAFYGKPIYLQESAPNRNAEPDAAAIKAYFDALKRLVADGTLVRFNYWGLWGGDSVGLLNDDLTLNEIGIALKDFYGGGVVTPPPPDPDTGHAELIAMLTSIEEKIDTEIANIQAVETKLAQAKAIVWGLGTTSSKISKLKTLLPQ